MMRNLVIILTVVMLVVFAVADPGGGGGGPRVPTPWVGPGCVADIPVLMDIEPVASIALNDAVIRLEVVNGSLDYAGVTLPPNQPVLTCNVPVTVSAETTGVAPLVTDMWYTALQGQDWALPGGNPGDPSVINVDPPATPFILDVAVLAENVDMTVRPQGLDARVATTTLTVVPRP